MAYCSVPRLLGFGKWFETRFGGLCKQHDKYYAVGILPRKAADCYLMSGIVLKGYPVFGFLTYIAVRLFGWLHYGVRK